MEANIKVIGKDCKLKGKKGKESEEENYTVLYVSDKNEMLSSIHAKSVKLREQTFFNFNDALPLSTQHCPTAGMITSSRSFKEGGRGSACVLIELVVLVLFLL
jgi:hypothetical protein